MTVLKMLPFQEMEDRLYIGADTQPNIAYITDIVIATQDTYMAFKSYDWLVMNSALFLNISFHFKGCRGQTC